jgi:hypothetical protein
MHEITISTSDKPKLFSQVSNLICYYTNIFRYEEKQCFYSIFPIDYAILLTIVIILRHDSYMI